MHLCKILYTKSKQNQSFLKRLRTVVYNKREENTTETYKQRKGNAALV